MSIQKFRRGVEHIRKYDSKDVIDSLPEGPETEVTSFLEHEIRYQPRRSEGKVIAEIERVADEVIEYLFADTERQIDEFYTLVRKVEMHDVGGGLLMPKFGEDGRPVWARDDDGNFIEDWRTLDGMDVERLIMALQRVIMEAGEEVERLRSRMLMAQAVKEDEWYEAYRSVLDGTVKDREAFANRNTRESRYYFFFAYWVWRRADQRLESYRSFKKDMEFMRSRFLKDPSVIEPREISSWKPSARTS